MYLRHTSVPAHLVGIGIVMAAAAATFAIDAARDLLRPAEASSAQFEKRQLAALGELELERAVQDFKDSILRDDPVYYDRFYKHLEAVDRAAVLYRSLGDLEAEESDTLAALREAVPAYRSAIYTVRRMRESSASIREIDSVVKGVDRPIAAAFDKLESLASDQRAERRARHGQWVKLVSSAALTCLFILLSWAAAKWWRPPGGDRDRLLRDLSNGMARWEEEEKARAFSRLHDGVCESLTGVMYLLTSVESRARLSGAPALALPEPVIPSLQEAIRDTRAVALKLRPPKLQNSGVLATLDSFWIDCKASKPGFQIAARTGVQEDDIPGPLKHVIVRVAKMAFELAARDAASSALHWELAREGNELRLAVDIELRPHSDKATDGSESVPESFLCEAIQARVVMSGGHCAGIRYRGHQRVLHAVWSLEELC